MKTIILIFSTLLFSSQTFALTDQIYLGENYDFKKNLFIKDQTKKDVVLSEEQQAIIDQYSEEQVTINKDIGPSHKKSPMVFLIKYLYQIEPLTDLYDDQFIKFVKSRQKTNGLRETGVLDPVTWFSVFEQPLEWKIDVVEKALQNWSDIIKKNEKRKNKKMIVINVPSQQLYLYEKNENGEYTVLLNSKVILGKPKTPTPIRDFDILSIKFNPSWTPTDNILERNLFDDNGKLNEEWIKSHGIVLYDEQGEPRDWADLEKINNPRFIQPPGDDNALGNLKFETTSKDDVYLHDTNERFYFKHNTRLYSSGCIRVQNYLELASKISDLNESALIDKINEGEVSYSPIKRIPVYIDYSMVHFREDGGATFYPDIYNKMDN